MQTIYTNAEHVGRYFTHKDWHGFTYKLVRVIEHPFQNVLWCNVVRVGDASEHPYMVRQDSLRPVTCVICGKRPVQIVVNACGAGYCSADCEASYDENAKDYITAQD